MAKYGIGARVRDEDGDVAKVIGKRKGFREVRYSGGKMDGIVVEWPKSSLVPANDQEVVAKGDEVLAGQVVSENACGWVPKVGDRVKVVKHCNVDGHPLSLHAPIGSEHTITELRNYFADKGVPTFILSGGGWNFYMPANVEPVVAPATTAADPWHEGTTYKPIAGATATLKSVYGKPGLVVRCETWRGELFTVGREYAFDADGKVTSDDGVKWSAIYSGEWSIVTPAAPAAKFKVGDRVVALEGTNLLKAGQEYEILGYEREGRVLVHVDLHGSPYENTCSEDWFAPAPTIPIGSTVTFTATGRLSAINENGHYQVTFPGLAPAKNSFALPADYVSLAN